jgi:hypothetical protein
MGEGRGEGVSVCRELFSGDGSEGDAACVRTPVHEFDDQSCSAPEVAVGESSALSGVHVEPGLGGGMVDAFLDSVVHAGAWIGEHGRHLAKRSVVQMTDAK